MKYLKLFESFKINPLPNALPIWADNTMMLDIIRDRLVNISDLYEVRVEKICEKGLRTNLKIQICKLSENGNFILSTLDPSMVSDIEDLIFELQSNDIDLQRVDLWFSGSGDWFNYPENISRLSFPQKAIRLVFEKQFDHTGNND